MPTDPNVTKPPAAGTKPGGRVTALLRGRLGQLALWTALVLPRAVVSSVSVASDLAKRGLAFHPAEPWIWELSSAFALLIWLLPVLRLDEAMRARVRPWPVRLAVYVPASVAYAAAHVATMVALRHAVYALAGARYDFGPVFDGFVYEYRKDALTFAMILAVASVWRALTTVHPVPAVAPGGALGPDAPVTSSAPSESSPAAPPTFLVRTSQGDLLVRADEIDWIEAQGNYVALHVGDQPRLLRHTLAEMESRLAAHGFIRTHRRALVNRERMQAILPAERGELGVRLTSGQVAPLSESRRAGVLALVLGTPTTA